MASISQLACRERRGDQTAPKGQEGRAGPRVLGVTIALRKLAGQHGLEGRGQILQEPIAVHEALDPEALAPCLEVDQL